MCSVHIYKIVTHRDMCPIKNKNDSLFIYVTFFAMQVFSETIILVDVK